MAKLRFLAVGAMLLVGLVAFSQSGSTAQAQQGNQGNRQANLVLGNLIAALLNVNVQDLNVEIENVLNRSLNRNTIQVVNVEDVLNDADIDVNVLRDILNNSQFLNDNVRNIRIVVRDNEILTDFLNENDIDIDDVVAIDVENNRIILFLLSAVDAD